MVEHHGVELERDRVEAERGRAAWTAVSLSA